MSLNLGERLARIGERHDLPWLTENPLVFRYYHRVARASAPGVMRTLEHTFPDARRYLDIGAGTGAFAAEAGRRGREVVACEYSPVGRLFARAQRVDCRPFDLTADVPAQIEGPFDLAYCFEVGQQLDEELGRRLVEFTAKQAPIVIFSSAQPGQGGVGAINKQPKDYWIESFKQAGMLHRPELSRRVSEEFAQERIAATWLIENVIVLTTSH